VCGTGVESSRVESRGGSCSVNAFFYLWAVIFYLWAVIFYLWAVISRVVASVSILVLCVVVVVVRDVFENVDTFFERVSLVLLVPLVSFLNRYWFDLYAHSWLHLKDDDHIDIEGKRFDGIGRHGTST
jgi:hypothetical protein